MDSRSRAISIAGPTATADMRPRGQSYSPRRIRGPNWLTRFWRVAPGVQRGPGRDEPCRTSMTASSTTSP